MIQQTNLDPSITNKTADLVSGLTSYILLFEDDEIDIPDDNSQVIKAESFEEAADFLRLLGDSCLPLLSSEYRRIHPGIYERLIDIASSERSAEAPFNIGQAELLLNKLPLDLKSLTKSHIALRSDDKAPPLIDKSYVHKNLDANVLVSEPFITGWLRYFNIFTNTTEFNFDHDSDHIQGMLLLEALRQAGIASAHYQGLPLDGKLALLNYNTKFLVSSYKDIKILTEVT